MWFYTIQVRTASHSSNHSSMYVLQACKGVLTSIWQNVQLVMHSGFTSGKNETPLHVSVCLAFEKAESNVKNTWNWQGLVSRFELSWRNPLSRYERYCSVAKSSLVSPPCMLSWAHWDTEWSRGSAAHQVCYLKSHRKIRDRWIGRLGPGMALEALTLKSWTGEAVQCWRGPSWFPFRFWSLLFANLQRLLQESAWEPAWWRLTLKRIFLVDLN